jgi:hypothetical protein
MREQQITGIILAATEMGGMGDDYFERKTRHLLPIAEKPLLIQHLIETVDNCKQIGEKHIIIEEKVEENGRIKPCEEVYKSVFGDRVGPRIIFTSTKLNIRLHLFIGCIPVVHPMFFFPF